MTKLPFQRPVNELSEKEARDELTALAQQISYHDQLYYQKDTPEISDHEYDQLRLRNKQLEKHFPHLILKNSPEKQVGAAPAKKFGKIEHKVPMLSLSNAFHDDDLADFYQRIYRFLKWDPATQPIELVAEPKIDGLSASLHYQKGKYILGATRGDGYQGENVTNNLATITDIPKILPPHIGPIPDYLEIRGEVYMTQSDFYQLNEERQKQNLSLFANPRNAAAGSLRQLDANITKRRPLKFFAYAHGFCSQPLKETHWDFLALLQQWGFSVNSQKVLAIY